METHNPSIVRIITSLISFVVLFGTSIDAFSQDSRQSLDDVLKAEEAENAKLVKLKELRQQNEKLRAELGLSGAPSQVAASSATKGTESPRSVEKDLDVRNAVFAAATNPELVPVVVSDVKAASLAKSTGEPASEQPAGKISPTAAETPKPISPGELNERVQVYFGTEIVGASAAASDAQPFFNLRLNIPIKNKTNCNSTSNTNLRCLKFWSDFRLASSPSQTLPNFTTLEGAGNFFGSNQSSSINQLVKSFQTKIGLEFGIGEGFSFIGGAGITSPLSPTQSIKVYKIPRLASGEVLPSFKEIFGDTDYSGLENLILTTGERDRFLRNWFLGGRLRHKFWDDAYPAEFDLTVGQDEVITRKLVGGILKFDATVPFKVGNRDFLYFGAGFGLKLTRRVNVVTLPFFLEPIADYSLFANSNLIRNIDDTPFGNSNRDNYSFRIGVDLLRLLNK